MSQTRRDRGLLGPAVSRVAKARDLVPLLALIAVTGGAAPADPFQAALARGLADDLAGNQAAAFAEYQRAAAGGLAQAQLNVAVMYDSGHGTAPDPQKAALYYALAASNGEPRAAYDLGQLYAAGEGLPQNPEMAQAWYGRAAALGLRAGVSHLNGATPPPPQAAPGAVPHAPDLLYPGPDARLENPGHTSFVWAAPVQPAATVYFIEIHPLSGAQALDAEPSTVLSALSFPLPNGAFAWRVFAVSPSTARYATTPWQSLTLVAPKPPAG